MLLKVYGSGAGSPRIKGRRSRKQGILPSQVNDVVTHSFHVHSASPKPHCSQPNLNHRMTSSSPLCHYLCLLFPSIPLKVHKCFLPLCAPLPWASPQSPVFLTQPEPQPLTSLPDRGWKCVFENTFWGSWRIKGDSTYVNISNLSYKLSLIYIKV